MEIVGIAAIKRCLLFDGKDQTDVGVLLVAVEPIFAAGIECDDVGTQTGLLRVSFSMAAMAVLRLANSSSLVFASLMEALTLSVTFSMETSRLTSRSGDFISCRVGVRTVAHVVVVGGRCFCNWPSCYVVICEEQAMGTDERTRAAVIEADRGFSLAACIEPLLGGSEVLYFHGESFTGGYRKVHMPSSAELAGAKRAAVSSAAETWRTTKLMFTAVFLISIGV